MRKLIVGLTLVAVLVLALVPAVGAAPNGPAEMANGGAGFTEPNGTHSSTAFSVRETGAGDAGTGQIRVFDETGFWFVADIEYAAVEGDMLFAAGPITASSVPGLVGLWFSAAALDAGEPGAGVDTLWGYPTTMAEAVANVTNRVTPGEPLVIDTGNVQVHSFE